MDMLGIVQKAAVLLESEMALSAEGDLGMRGCPCSSVPMVRSFSASPLSSFLR